MKKIVDSVGVQSSKVQRSKGSKVILIEELKQ